MEPTVVIPDTAVRPLSEAALSTRSLGQLASIAGLYDQLQRDDPEAARLHIVSQYGIAKQAEQSIPNLAAPRHVRFTIEQNDSDFENIRADLCDVVAHCRKNDAHLFAAKPSSSIVDEKGDDNGASATTLANFSSTIIPAESESTQTVVYWGGFDAFTEARASVEDVARAPLSVTCLSAQQPRLDTLSGDSTVGEAMVTAFQTAHLNDKQSDEKSVFAVAQRKLDPGASDFVPGASQVQIVSQPGIGAVAVDDHDDETSVYIEPYTNRGTKRRVQGAKKWMFYDDRSDNYVVAHTDKGADIAIRYSSKEGAEANKSVANDIAEYVGNLIDTHSAPITLEEAESVHSKTNIDRDHVHIAPVAHRAYEEAANLSTEIPQLVVVRLFGMRPVAVEPQPVAWSHFSEWSESTPGATNANSEIEGKTLTPQAAEQLSAFYDIVEKKIKHERADQGSILNKVFQISKATEIPEKAVYRQFYGDTPDFRAALGELDSEAREFVESIPSFTQWLRYAQKQ